MIRLTKSATALILACTSLALTAPALAAPVTDGDIPQAELNVAGTDFTSPKAINSLQHRVRRLAREICTRGGDGRQMMTPDETKCYNTAVNGALAQIDAQREQALTKLPARAVAANTETRNGH